MGHPAWLLSTAGTTVGLATLTVAAYAVSRTIFLRSGHPLANPVFLTAGSLIVCLEASGLTFDSYQPVRDVFTWPIGVATVALAVPVYNHRARLAPAAIPLVVGVFAGCVATIAVVLGLASLGRLEPAVLHALGLKSVTAAVAVELVKLHGGDPSLTAPFVLATGAIGAMMGPLVLSWTRITNPIARGIALGAISHAQGTAAALVENEASGAVASLSMLAAAVITSLLTPTYIPWLLHLLGA